MDDAEAAYRKALGLNPRLAGAQIGLARMLLRKGQRQEAAKLLEDARRTSPDNPQVRLVRRALLNADGKTAEAIKELESVPTSARSMQVLIALAELYSQAGRHNDAIELLTRVTTRFPNALVARHLLGQVAMRARRSGLAIAEFNEVAKQVPTNPWARLSLAGAYLQASRPEEALQELDRVAKPLGKVPDYHLQRGLAYLML